MYIFIERERERHISKNPEPVLLLASWRLCTSNRLRNSTKRANHMVASGREACVRYLEGLGFGA